VLNWNARIASFRFNFYTKPNRHIRSLNSISGARDLKTPCAEDCPEDSGN